MSALRLLIISKGFGGGCTGQKWQYLAAQDGFELHMPLVPEFAEGSTEGLATLRDAVSTFKPDILVACSRGGQYASALVQAGDWAGPVFCISAMYTADLCAAHDGGTFVSCAHGKLDGTNPIERVRADVAMSRAASLVEFDDDHELAELVGSGSFGPLLRALGARTSSAAARAEWLHTERPEWIARVLQPSLEADSSVGSAELEQARQLHRSRIGLMAALASASLPPPTAAAGD